ncbi:non-specific lipid transfer protein GPI-anchored 9-like [Lolium rigidum]|uniref:non-specific lipid transfer protein GPI-anchored 9-like n=1 Tax=Lolium rigidum TaxID=89674 RepID=UPI001F5DFAF3|nr:non-specific lipid transfer protein GPI-anchored 9-like [Lolium rigidum]
MAMRAVVVLLAAAVSLFAAGALAQTTEPPSCTLKLVGCAAYMNGTDAETPPDTCCGPLRDAVQNERTCLCALYVSPAIFAAYNINVTDAVRLPKRCGISEDVTSCPSDSPSTSPLGNRCSPSTGKNAGHRTVSASFAGFMSLFLVLWSALA